MCWNELNDCLRKGERNEAIYTRRVYLHQSEGKRIEENFVFFAAQSIFNMQ